ncbi:unnamed protein product [Discosporangium mesarthrocarpum]
MSGFMKHLSKPIQKLKPGLLPKNLIPPKRWTILRGDDVMVVNGVHRGKKGTVKEVIRKQNRVIVEGVNMRKYQEKPKNGQGRGKTVTREAAIHVSNVNVVCPETGLPTKVSRRFLEDGTKVRVAKRSGAVIPRPAILEVRRTPRSNVIGPRDTLEEDVNEVTFRGLDEQGLELPLAK